MSKSRYAKFLDTVAKFAEELATLPEHEGMEILIDRDERGKCPSLSVRARPLSKVTKTKKAKR